MRIKLSLVTIQQSQEVANGAVRFNRVPQRLIGPNLVVILAAYLFPFDKSAGFKIGDDSLHRAFGDSDLLCDLAEHQGRIACQQHEHM